MCVVAHTHWDREWYHVAPRFRQGLVALVDALLADSTGPFLLDGQAITLRDYLRVRPEAEPALRHALRTRRLEAGPWYVLADNLIPGGEALVRNLEAGARVLRQLDALPPRVAYCPDSFGHPAAMPMVAAEFGLPVAVVWRGVGGHTHPRTDLFRWQSPNGSTVLAHHLPPDGYEFGSALPVTHEAAARRWAELEALWRQRTGGAVALLLNGADHHAAQPDLAEAITALQLAAGPRAHVERTTLEEWAARLSAAAVPPSLPIVVGELRDSYGYTWTLAGTTGTRAHQKRRNARLERGLLRDVEPWLALLRLQPEAAAHAPHAAPVRPDPAARLTMAQLPALLHCAWEELLATHPHDTLCGCSVDTVARSMELQQDLVAEQGQGLREAALQQLLGYDPVAARQHVADFDWRRVVLRNRAPCSRGGIAEVTLFETLGDEPVGPGSAGAIVAEAPSTATGALFTPPAPVHQRLGTLRTRLRRESPQHYPDNDLVRAHRLLLWVPPVPALGIDAWDAARWTAPPVEPPCRVTRKHVNGRTVLHNGRLTLELDEATRAVTLRVDDRALPQLLALELQQDAGDSYTASLRGAVERMRCTSARVVATGPLRAKVRLRWSTASTRRRPGPDARVVVVTDLVVDAMSPVVQCHIRGRSWRTDMRLQLVWNTDVTDGRVWADAAFGPLQRDPITAPAHTREAVPDTMPMHRWAMHASPLFGATMIADGLAEAVVHDRRLALTLVRAVGELSRNDLPERPGHAGWPCAIPEAQCLGPFSARTALLLHGPMSDDVLARVRDACDDVLLPLTGESWRDLPRAIRCHGPEVAGEAFELSAFTPSAQDEHAAVLRVVNNTLRSAWGTLRFPDDGPWEVTPCRLDETAVGPPSVVAGAFSFEGAPRAVLTFRVKRSP